MSRLLRIAPMRVIGFEKGGYRLTVTNELGEYVVAENGQRVVTLPSLVKALSEFYRRKEDAERSACT